MGLQSLDSEPRLGEEEAAEAAKRGAEEEDSPVKVKSGLRKTGLTRNGTLKRSISLPRHPFFKKHPKLNTSNQGSPEKVSQQQKDGI